MTYNLRPVIEEIQRSAEECGDRRTSKMCLGMLKAMRNRPDQNCVAYRKVRLQQQLTHQCSVIFLPKAFTNVLVFSTCLLHLFQGLGVVCNKKGGFGEDDFVVEFFGEVCFIFYINLFHLTRGNIIAMDMSICKHCRFTLLGDGMKSKMVSSIYKTTVKIKLLSFTTLCQKGQR